MIRLANTLAALGLAALLTPAILPLARAAEVKLEADLGQPVVPAAKREPIYLRLSVKALAGAKTERRTPVNVALVLDRSGSMAGPRIAAARDAAVIALSRLAADDTVAVVTYDHNVDLLRPSARLGTSLSTLEAQIRKLQPGGTTALHAGVVEGGRQVKEGYAPNKVNRVILMSDGLANVGPSTPKELGDLGRELGSQGIPVTTIGLGLEYNEDLMARLAGASDGNHAFVARPSDLVEIFNKEFGDALSIAAQDLVITVDCKEGFLPKRVLGREADISGNRVTVKLNQLQEQNERYIVLEVESPASAPVGETSVASIGVSYLDLGTNARSETRVEVKARVSASESEAEASINKAVLAQVTAQIATEESERAVTLRDKGDITGARKVLEENAARLKQAAETYGAGLAAAPTASVDMLNGLETKNREAAGNLEGEAWGSTRKSMRYDQHKTKVQQAY